MPGDWVPAQTRTNGWVIEQSGVYENIRVLGAVEVRASNVTLRQVEVVGGVIDNEYAGRCFNGLLLDRVTVRDSAASNGAVQPGGYTAVRTKLVNVGEGFRIGGRSDAGCGPVTITDSLARILKPANVSCNAWHGDAIQGFDAPTATVTNTTLDARNNQGCGTAGVFYGSAETWGNQKLTVRGVLIFGGAVAYRPDTPHDTVGLRVVQGTYGVALGTDSSGNYTCRRATNWADNAVSDPFGRALSPLNC